MKIKRKKIKTRSTVWEYVFLDISILRVEIYFAERRRQWLIQALLRENIHTNTHTPSLHTQMHLSRCLLDVIPPKFLKEVLPTLGPSLISIITPRFHQIRVRLRYVSATPAELIAFTLVYVLTSTRSTAPHICSADATGYVSANNNIANISILHDCLTAIKD